MPAPKGNNYAEKWTRDVVLSALEQIQDAASDPTCLWLGSAMVRVGLYRELWSYWAEKFKDDDEVFQTIKKIDQIFEDRQYILALRNKANSAVAIFGLKNNYGWTDRKEIDHTTQGEPINNINIKIISDADAVTNEDDIDEDI